MGCKAILGIRSSLGPGLLYKEVRKIFISTRVDIKEQRVAHRSTGLFTGACDYYIKLL